VPGWLGEAAEKLIEMLDSAGTPVVVTAHRNADPDAVSSALAVRHAVLGLGYDARLVLPEGLNQAAKRLVREVLGRSPSDVEDEPPEESAMAIVVDTASPEQLGPLQGFVEEVELLVVIDHHESNSLVKRAALAVYDPGARAAAELTYMLLRLCMGVRLPKPLSTMLLAGIIYDTRHLVMAAPRTLRVAADLMDEGADRDAALKALQSPPMELPERIARLKAATRARVFRAGSYLLAVSHVGAYEASACRALLELGADLAIVAAERGETTRIIGRARRGIVEALGLHLGSLMEEVARRLGGGGGGHAQAAGATVKACLEEAVNEVVRQLEEFMASKGMEMRPID